MFEQYEYVLQDPEALGQIIGASIGVIGLFIGTFITIIISLLTRQLDIRREEKKEEIYLRRDKKEKEFSIKREVYTKFIAELAALENFISNQGNHELNIKSLEKFKTEWNKTEIKVDLIAPPPVKELKEKLQNELFEMAENKFADKSSGLSEEYTTNRDNLLQAIREDMEIN
ncbi:hypothetical protein GF376_03300 [Candidatus Peregrinibacteria bacterium]|nr:hypothetical protein [Candidatus Peregrinibacteria bacterium]